jgi:glycosyltransferase involved in cell wall biosynthesis
MMLDTALYGATLAWLSAKAGLNVAEIVGSSIYSIRQTNWLKSIQKHPYSRRLRHLPLISVVIYAHDAEKNIRECLDSIRSSRYRKVEIIVVEYASHDETRRAVKEYIRMYPKQSIRLVTKRSPPQSWQSLSPTSHIHGELVAYLHGRERLDPHMLHKAARHFAWQDINILLPAPQILPQKSILGLLQLLHAVQAGLAMQLGVWSGKNSCIMRSHLISDNQPAYFADDVRLCVEPHRTYASYFRDFIHSKPRVSSMQNLGAQRRLLSRLLQTTISISYQLVHVSEPIAIGYFVYLALTVYTPQPLILAWILTMSNLLFALLADRSHGWRSKVRISSIVPSIYPVLYILSCYWLIDALHRALAIVFGILSRKVHVSSTAK